MVRDCYFMNTISIKNVSHLKRLLNFVKLTIKEGKITHLCYQQSTNTILKVMLFINHYLSFIFVPNNVCFFLNISHLKLNKGDIPHVCINVISNWQLFGQLWRESPIKLCKGVAMISLLTLSLALFLKQLIHSVFKGEEYHTKSFYNEWLCCNTDKMLPIPLKGSFPSPLYIFHLDNLRNAISMTRAKIS